MDFFVNKTRICRSLMHAFAFTIALLLTAAPNMALAKSGGGDDLRTAYSGIVQARPESGLHGEWVIGGRTFAADARTEFDQSEGKLVVGSCAKVQVRDGRVHEIDSGPMQDCQWGTCVAGRPVRHRQGTCQRFSGCSIYSL